MKYDNFKTAFYTSREENTTLRSANTTLKANFDGAKSKLRRLRETIRVLNDRLVNPPARPYFKTPEDYHKWLDGTSTVDDILSAISDYTPKALGSRFGQWAVDPKSRAVKLGSGQSVKMVVTVEPDGNLSVTVEFGTVPASPPIIKP